MFSMANSRRTSARLPAACKFILFLPSIPCTEGWRSLIIIKHEFPRVYLFNRPPNFAHCLQFWFPYRSGEIFRWRLRVRWETRVDGWQRVKTRINIRSCNVVDEVCCFDFTHNHLVGTRGCASTDTLTVSNHQFSGPTFLMIFPPAMENLALYFIPFHLSSLQLIIYICIVAALFVIQR